MGCFLMARSDQNRAVRIFDDLSSSLEQLKQEIGDELDHWNNPAGRPRIGFRRQGGLAFLSGSENSDEYRAAVTWMQQHLDLLVSTLHPRLQDRLAVER